VLSFGFGHREATPSMEQRDIEFFRNLLNQRVKELRSEAGKTVENMDEDENFPDPSDRATMESNRNSVLRIRDRERKLIFKIQEALQRLDDGEFGICEECGEAIGIERLKARPVTTFCIECKSSQEVQEKKAKRAI
jgi:DnaK suppressor protein